MTALVALWLLSPLWQPTQLSLFADMASCGKVADDVFKAASKEPELQVKLVLCIPIGSAPPAKPIS